LKIFRGNKALSAEIRGAAGVLIYIDPADTGELKGPVYPEGPWSTNSTVQRGTVWTGTGDPSTPGWYDALFARVAISP
jgi:N-acetylated-alpha-linked acidic dipeptidase